MLLQIVRADANCMKCVRSVGGSTGLRTHALDLVWVILCILIKLILDVMKLLLMLGHI